MTTETIPQEAGINERAVSFTKGCYIGQETVARLHYKGKPNRHLRGLRSEAPLAEGEEVHVGEKAVGRVGTAVLSPALGPVALAILRREAEPGSTVLVGGSTTAEVVELPFETGASGAMHSAFRVALEWARGRSTARSGTARRRSPVARRPRSRSSAAAAMTTSPTIRARPLPILVTAKVDDQKVVISPKEFGAGLVTFAISNQSDDPVSLTLVGPAPEDNEASTEIPPAGVDEFKAEMAEGDYEINGGERSDAKPAQIAVGPERESSKDQLLLP